MLDNTGLTLKKDYHMLFKADSATADEEHLLLPTFRGKNSIRMIDTEIAFYRSILLFVNNINLFI